MSTCLVLHRIRCRPHLYEKLNEQHYHRRASQSRFNLFGGHDVSDGKSVKVDDDGLGVPAFKVNFLVFCLIIY